MKIVTAIDSFKGSMTSMEAGRAVAEGIHRADAEWQEETILLYRHLTFG